MDISQRIKAIRVDKGIKQADLAKQLNMERTSYHRFENRGDKLTIEQASEIAKALGVTLYDLLVDDNGSGTELAKEISRCRTRIEELEDRIKDKQSIIDASSRGKGKLLEQIESAILHVGAYDLKLGSEHELTEALENYKNEPDNYMWLFPYKFSNEEYLKIVYHLYQTDQKYFYLVWRLIENGVIDSKKPFIKPFLVLSRMIWPNIESVPTYIKEAMDELGLTLTDLEAMAHRASITSN